VIPVDILSKSLGAKAGPEKLALDRLQSSSQSLSGLEKFLVSIHPFRRLIDPSSQAILPLLVIFRRIFECLLVVTGGKGGVEGYFRALAALP
jgi:hypothetical protein